MVLLYSFYKLLLPYTTPVPSATQCPAVRFVRPFCSRNISLSSLEVVVKGWRRRRWWWQWTFVGGVQYLPWDHPLCQPVPLLLIVLFMGVNSAETHTLIRHHRRNSFYSQIKMLFSATLPSSDRTRQASTLDRMKKLPFTTPIIPCGCVCNGILFYLLLNTSCPLTLAPTPKPQIVVVLFYLSSGNSDHFPSVFWK